MLKKCVKNFNASWKLIHVENYVENFKFFMLKTVMRVENSVEKFKACENVYVSRVENHIENRVEVRKKSTVTFHLLVRIYTIFWDEICVR